MAEQQNPPIIPADPNVHVDGQPRLANDDGRVNQVQIKIPPFWKADPDLWFLQIEAQFATAGIRADLSKYNQIVGKLDTDTLTAVSDIVKNPPATDKYQALKDRLTNQFAESDRKKLKALFSDLSLNDDKPSDLLRRMKDKSCNKIGDELLRELWAHRLPQQIQGILSCSNETLAQQVIMADKIHDTMDFTTIQAFSSQQQTVQQNDYAQQFCKLEDSINSLKKEFNRSRSRTNSARRNRSHSRSNHRTSNNRSTYCWYHQQFREKAKKCDDKLNPPCTFTNRKSRKN